MVVAAPDAETAALVEDARGYLAHLGKVTDLTAGVGLARPKKSAVAVAGRCTVYVLLEGVIDLGEEVVRLGKAVAKLDKDIEGLGKKLGNAAFVKNAPPEVVAEQQKRLDEARSQRETYLSSIEALS